MLQSDENPAGTYPGMAAVLLDASIDDVDFSVVSPMDVADDNVRSFMEAALSWRDHGRRDDETFTKALNTLETMTARMASERSSLKNR
ncbi:hypothetical protein [Roseibium sp. RKSG952]|uniref:hypothetical protein n=1 Tax=Roseibium sp. RKSG952 TaxID=2529384 RepID=UPI0018AD19C3|nr:hypothetical protein [Roseibium sp. RKSG952]